MTDAAIGMAVFLEDRTVFEQSVRRYRARVPAYFCLTSDGKLPKPPPGGTITKRAALSTYWWFGQRTCTDGLGQETYTGEAERPRAALEFHARCVRPELTLFFVAWETLTHAANPPAA
jgi:hypothetical protein